MKERNTVFLLTLAAGVFRILHFWAFSDELVVGSDQMPIISLARSFAAGDLSGVLDTYWTPLYPVLIGIVGYFVNSLILPSIIVAVVAGSLAVPLTFSLVKEFYDARTATIAAALAIFYPHLTNSVFALGSENVYLLWMNAALLVGWRALKIGSTSNFWLTGALLGLAYLTRPEAFAYPVFFALCAAVPFFRRRDKTFVRRRLIQIGALLLGFVIFAAPYIFYLRTATGNWTISGKTAINTVAAELPEAEEMREGGGDPATLSNYQKARIIFEAVYFNLITVHQSFPSFLPPLLLMLVALGLFRERWDAEKVGRESYLIAFCLITVLGYVVAVVQLRYFYLLLPIFFGWTARGIVQAEKWFYETLQSSLPRKFPNFGNARPFAALCLIFIYFYVLPLNFFVRSHEETWAEVAFEERAAGLWMKAQGKPSPLIFSVTRRPVFYAEGKQLPPTTTDAGEIFAEIKNAPVDYVVTGERSLKRHPFLKSLSEMLRNAPEFELVYENKEQPDYKILVFRCKPN